MEVEPAWGEIRALPPVPSGRSWEDAIAERDASREEIRTRLLTELTARKVSMDPDEWDDIATATEHTAGGKQFNAELDRAKNDQNRAYQEVNRVTSSVTSLFGTGVGARLNEVLAEERRSANFVEVLMRNRIEELAQEVLRLEEELKQKGKS